MNGKYILICVLAAMLLPLVGCAGVASASATVAITCDDFGKQPEMSREVRVPAGSSLEVTLCSNASTGFKWEEAQIADGSKIAAGEHKTLSPNKAMPGAPGTEVWTFKALQKGSTTISFAYSRPWAGGEKGTWKLALTVVVE